MTRWKDNGLLQLMIKQEPILGTQIINVCCPPLAIDNQYRFKKQELFYWRKKDRERQADRNTEGIIVESNQQQKNLIWDPGCLYAVHTYFLYFTGEVWAGDVRKKQIHMGSLSQAGVWNLISWRMLKTGTNELVTDFGVVYTSLDSLFPRLGFSKLLKQCLFRWSADE